MISLYIVWQVRKLLLLVFTAIVLATAINHLVQRFQRSGAKRSGSVLLSVGLVVASLRVISWLIVPPFAEQFQDLINAFFSTPVNFLLEFFLVLVLTLMLLANPQPYQQVFIRFFPLVLLSSRG